MQNDPFRFCGSRGRALVWIGSQTNAVMKSEQIEINVQAKGW